MIHRSTRIHGPGSALRKVAQAAWLLCLLSLLATASAVAEPYRFDGVERVVAVGDVHGAYPELVELLQAAGILDAQLHWAGGRSHLVSVGDLLDRGDQSRQVVELLMRLETEAAAAGGAVHVLLGNHEIMSLTGDLRYASRGDFAAFAGGAAGESSGAAEPAAQPAASAPLPTGYMQRLRALAPDGPIGSWLLQRPLMIVVNGDLYVHGGLSAKLQGLSLEQINRDGLREVRAFAGGWHALLALGALQPGEDFDAIVAAARRLAAEPEDSPARTAAAAIVEAVKGLPFEPEGPAWYRGSSLCHPYTELPVLEPLLAGLDARRLVVGHTPTADRRIGSRLDGRVLRIDTGMNKAFYQGNATALIVEGERTSVFQVGTGALPPRIEDNREWARPYGMSDAQIEEFLDNATVVQSENLDVGITHPRRLTLERDGRRLRAVFKTLDTDKGIENGVWRRSHDSADRFVYDVAAYKLDRILGLNMVPAAVLRRIDGRAGVVQYWLEGTFNDVEREDRKIAFDGECSLIAQFNLMNAFDVLVHNTDRNRGNVLYDRSWQVWLIDHSRAFGTERRAPRLLSDAKIEVTAPLAAALEKLTAESLQPLAPYLNPRQIQALLHRAKTLRQDR